MMNDAKLYDPVSRVSCDVCGGTNVSKNLNAWQHYVWSCGECGFMFATPHRGAPLACYDGDYFDAFIERDRSPAVLKQYLEVLGEYEALVPGRRLLDVGCGAGAFLCAAKTRRWDVLGVDGSEAALKYAAETYGVNVEISDLETCEFPAAAFDVVRAFHCVEHLRHPGRFLRACANTLVSGGMLHVSLPFYTKTRIRTHQALYRLGLARFPYDFGLPDHVSYFSPRTLIAAMEGEGLRVERVWYGARRSLNDLAKHLHQAGGVRAHLGTVMSLFSAPLSLCAWHEHINVIARRLPEIRHW